MEIIEQNQRTNMSDDEDELELLRKAALQTIKKAADKPTVFTNPIPAPLIGKNKFNPSSNSKRGRGFHNSGVPRGLLRNGQYNGRNNRNSNLISIPTMESQNDNKMKDTHNDTAAGKPKLILPQDRYCGKVTQEVTEKEKVSSKFSRYEDDDDSDDSDSDNSEPEASKISEGKLRKASSLDALVQELEFEISGEKPAANKKAKIKKAKREHSDSASLSDNDTKKTDKDVDDEKPADEDAVELFVEDKIEDDDEDDTNKPVKYAVVQTRRPEIIQQQVPMRKVDEVVRRPIRKSPQKGLLPKPKGFNNNGRPSPPMGLIAPRRPNPNAQFNSHGPNQNFHPQYPQNNINVYNNDVPYLPQHRPIYPSKKPLITLPPYSHQPNNNIPPTRPLSPLKLNTEALSTITMAPLSPRSAAFVLQNREIIEKRKRSPRRSYSRSRSPSPVSRLRRSKSRSPRRLRTPSPRRYPRSTSPKRTSPRSPVAVRRNVARSPMRPRRSRSPIDRSPKQQQQRELKERPLNNNRRVERVDRHEEGKRRRTASPELPTKVRREDNKVKEVKVVVEVEKDANPVLEARRKKFEQQNSINKEGIIRLKAKEKEKEAEAVDKNENIETHDDNADTNDKDDKESPEQLSTNEIFEDDDDAFDLDTLETKIDDIFSDEESDDDENEARFKSSSTTKRTVAAPVLPFSQLMNGPIRDMKNKSLEDTCRDRDRDRRGDARTRNERFDRLDRNRERSNRSERDTQRKHRSPLPERKERVERKDDRSDRKELRRDDDSSGRRGVRDNDRKVPVKSRITLRRGDRAEDERPAKVERVERVSPPIEKKIVEVKLTRHTRKVESDYDVSEAKKIKMKERPMMARKVAIAKDVKELKENDVQHDDDDDDDVVLTVIDDDEDEKDVIKKNEAGDLRAQLSRKRAERQNQKPTVTAEDVQSRLLHNALGAVFQKSKKTKRTDVEAAPKEKLPIHQRLGLGKEIDEPTKKKKKSKRSTEQV